MMCVLYKVHLQHSPNAQLGFTAVVALLCQLPLATAGAARSPQSHCILLVLALSNLPGTFSWKMEELFPSQHLLSLGLKKTLIWHFSKVKSFLA